jgi:hypothetical protein
MPGTRRASRPSVTAEGVKCMAYKRRYTNCRAAPAPRLPASTHPRRQDHRGGSSRRGRDRKNIQGRERYLLTRRESRLYARSRFLRVGIHGGLGAHPKRTRNLQRKAAASWASPPKGRAGRRITRCRAPARQGSSDSRARPPSTSRGNGAAALDAVTVKTSIDEGKMKASCNAGYHI